MQSNRDTQSDCIESCAPAMTKIQIVKPESSINSVALRARKGEESLREEFRERRTKIREESDHPFQSRPATPARCTMERRRGW